MNYDSEKYKIAINNPCIRNQLEFSFQINSSGNTTTKPSFLNNLLYRWYMHLTLYLRNIVKKLISQRNEHINPKGGNNMLNQLRSNQTKVSESI